MATYFLFCICHLSEFLAPFLEEQCLEVNHSSMKKLAGFMISTYLLALTQGTFGQTAKTNGDSAGTKPITVDVGLNYISNLTFAGRADTTKIPIFTPTVILISKSGFFLSAIGYYNASSIRKGFEGISLTPGYVYRFSDQVAGALSATKYLITDSSNLILSAIKGSVDANLFFNSNIINLELSSSYLISNNKDFLSILGVNKSFTANNVFKNTLFKLTPGFTLSAGSQSFYETYYKNTIIKGTPAGSSPLGGNLPGSNGGGLLGGLTPSNGTPPGSNPGNSSANNTPAPSYILTEKEEREIKKFQLLSADFSLPVSLTVGKLKFKLSPYYVIPFNQVQFSGSTVMKRDPYFYFTAGVSATF